MFPGVNGFSLDSQEDTLSYLGFTLHSVLATHVSGIFHGATLVLASLGALQATTIGRARRWKRFGGSRISTISPLPSALPPRLHRRVQASHLSERRSIAGSAARTQN